MHPFVFQSLNVHKFSNFKEHWTLSNNRFQRCLSEQPWTKTKRACEIACKDSSCFAYSWLMLSLREAAPAPSLRELWVIIVILVQPFIQQHAPRKIHDYKGLWQEMRHAAGLQEQPFLITIANCHSSRPLVRHSFKQQRERISLQTFEWICNDRTSCITCGTHDNYGRINTGGFMAPSAARRRLPDRHRPGVWAAYLGPDAHPSLMLLTTTTVPEKRPTLSRDACHGHSHPHSRVWINWEQFWQRGKLKTQSGQFNI